MRGGCASALWVDDGPGILRLRGRGSEEGSGWGGWRLMVDGYSMRVTKSKRRSSEDIAVAV